eukprot:TRINITY_DN2264_c0_g1_i11.p1 TRINITY_DN2264_c0_g1~~TRINITY_DN2264_c0_g1_i11.p1  ORF type:complete len:148 (-),score=35.31 TRINITY_DN2264_c0_g1_i11:68-511(-)
MLEEQRIADDTESPDEKQAQTTEESEESDALNYLHSSSSEEEYDKYCPQCEKFKNGGEFCDVCGTGLKEIESCAKCHHQLPIRKPNYCPSCGVRLIKTAVKLGRSPLKRRDTTNATTSVKDVPEFLRIAAQMKMRRKRGIKRSETIN